MASVASAIPSVPIVNGTQSRWTFGLRAATTGSEPLASINSYRQRAES